MSIFVISDLHLSFGVENKSMDVFNGWSGYVNKLKSNWNNLVKNQDTVVVVGDISWAMKLEEVLKDLQFLDSLNGKKILIKGNHEYWWESATKVRNFLNKNKLHRIKILFNSNIEVENFCICGTRSWNIILKSQRDFKIYNRELGRLIKSLNNNSKLEKIVFLHYPPVYDSQEAKEIIDILTEKKVKKCYYGHIHGSVVNKKIVVGDYKNINFKLVSCDYLDFIPIQV
ncbi:MAG: metallophosphoesterase [Candidatus Paraimprobicoccus trichonymphae]|uniref:Metallophosphoesterase n=1 Tax=Candidatus Paraimprobicoccus trichonymphae TaxID=3033793 RepID=A0AA48KZX3_9FIRM|nr:MAG: metallophosphoesterase [Candidatus Paraimprobicoccus trichonymphae]